MIPFEVKGRVRTPLLDAEGIELPAQLEPTYLDSLYVQFGNGMTWEQHKKFMERTRERKDYLFDLWLKKNGYV